MKRTLRLCIGVLVCLALVGFAITVLVMEILFGLEAVATTATVESYTSRSTLFGRGKASVVHEVNGEPIKATLRTWFFYYQPKEADSVAVLYAPSEPNRVEMDSFLQRFGPLALPIGLALAVANWAGLFRPLRETT